MGVASRRMASLTSNIHFLRASVQEPHLPLCITPDDADQCFAKCKSSEELFYWHQQIYAQTDDQEIKALYDCVAKFLVG